MEKQSPDSVSDIQYQFYYRGYSGKLSEVLPDESKILPSSRYKRILSYLPPGDQLLDVGCNDGLFLYLARSRFNHLHGVDIVSNRLAQAETWSRLAGIEMQLHCMNIDVEPLPYPADTFDAVVCIAVLEFVFDPVHAIQEMGRVLKPGGALGLQLGNIASWRNRMRLLAGRQPWTTRFQGAWNGGALHYFVRNELQSLLKREGFILFKNNCSGRLYHIRSLWPALLGSDMIIMAHKR